MNTGFSKTDVEAPEHPRELLLEAAVEMNLRLSYEARIEAHENARLLALDLSAAGKESSARSQSAATKTP
ncbi:MAG: hypothetical protein EB078_01365 [Proteobacteria bacterium]|nr:hypothetical protein [Pseudomonadota bacterium]NDD03528.1 hypothetical protein [Pseudomonadota bacterium]NDG27552.1 hypothetical protein [Pseudomonadota bacterium]